MKTVVHVVHTSPKAVICTYCVCLTVLQLSVTLSGNTSFDGRIIVTVDGKEGSVCNDEFDDKDATVICRMMGFHR